jgi:hypothetical protein
VRPPRARKLGGYQADTQIRGMIAFSEADIVALSLVEIE